MGTHKGSRGAHKGPKGAHKGPRGPTRGRTAFRFSNEDRLHLISKDLPIPPERHKETKTAPKIVEIS